MRAVPPEVMAHELDTVWQAIFTWTSWVIALGMIVLAVQMGRKQRTPFYLFACLAALVAAIAEPLYDVAFDLWFYDADARGVPGEMWSHFSAFGVPQPNWTHSGYVILYAAVALYAGKKMYEGRLSRNGLFAIWGAEILTSCVFEMIGTGTDVYTYYGPFELRLWNYPAVIGVLEGTQTVLFTVLAVQTWRRVKTGWGLSALFIAFPITFFGTNFGIGGPLIIALHLDGTHFSSTLVWIATFLTMGLCALTVRGASMFLPEAAREPDEDPAIPVTRNMVAV
jgi:hypothetical protein